MNNKQIKILYTNWKNETRERTILPIRIDINVNIKVQLGIQKNNGF